MSLNGTFRNPRRPLTIRWSGEHEQVVGAAAAEAGQPANQAIVPILGLRLEFGLHANIPNNNATST